MSDCPRSPPILRLPRELHNHIISFLRTEVPKCCLTGFALNPYKTRPSWYDRAFPEIDHDASSDHDTETVTVVHPAILLLRSTHPYFHTLIQLSQDLLLQILRHRSTPRPKFGPLRDVLGVCCVCLRLRPSHEFAIDAPSATPQNMRNHALWTLERGARYRFCRDCGFRAYPLPHPALPPQRQQCYRGNEPMGMTTYKPGTKVVSPRWSDKAGLCYMNWTWCLDCRLLKTSSASGDAACPMFCQECCVRLECGLEFCPQRGGRRLQYLHRGYARIEAEIEAETRRREHKLSSGAPYVAQGRSLLLKNVEHPVIDEEDEEENGRLDDAVWKAWFDFEGYPTIHVSPASCTCFTSGLPGNGMHMASTAISYFRRHFTSHSLEPRQWCVVSMLLHHRTAVSDILPDVWATSPTLVSTATRPESRNVMKFEIAKRMICS